MVSGSSPPPGLGLGLRGQSAEAPASHAMAHLPLRWRTHGAGTRAASQPRLPALIHFRPQHGLPHLPVCQEPPLPLGVESALQTRRGGAQPPFLEATQLVHYVPLSPRWRRAPFRGCCCPWGDVHQQYLRLHARCLCELKDQSRRQAPRRSLPQHETCPTETRHPLGAVKQACGLCTRE